MDIALGKPRNNFAKMHNLPEVSLLESILTAPSDQPNPGF